MRIVIILTILTLCFNIPAYAQNAPIFSHSSDAIGISSPLGDDLDLNGNDIVDGSVDLTSAGKLVAPNAITPLNIESPAFTLGPEHRGMIFASAGSDQGANTTISFSSASGLIAGECILVGNAGAGTIYFTSTGGAETIIPADMSSITGLGDVASVCVRSTTEVWVAGSLD